MRETVGTGSPEGVVTADPGWQYTDTTATGRAVRWIKASGAGNTGWRPVYSGWRRPVTPRDCELVAATFTASAGGTSRHTVIQWDSAATTRYSTVAVYIPEGVAAVDTFMRVITPDFASETAGNTAQIRADHQLLSDGTTPVTNGSGGTIGPFLDIPVDADDQVHTFQLMNGESVTGGQWYEFGFIYVGANSTNTETIYLMSAEIAESP